MNEKSGFFTYKQLLRKVNKFAACLELLGIRKGDKVILYLPDIASAAIANLAIWRLGAISIPVNVKLGENTLKKKLDNYKPALIITASCAVEGSIITNIKNVVNRARAGSSVPDLKCMVVQREIKQARRMEKGKDFDIKELEAKLTKKKVQPVPVEANHPSYIFQNESMQNINSGFVRDTAGLLVGMRASLQQNYDMKKHCTILSSAQLSWSFGINYSIVGPLSLGMQTVVTECFS